MIDEQKLKERLEKVIKSHEDTIDGIKTNIKVCEGQLKDLQIEVNENLRCIVSYQNVLKWIYINIPEMSDDEKAIIRAEAIGSLIQKATKPIIPGHSVVQRGSPEIQKITEPLVLGGEGLRLGKPRNSDVKVTINEDIIKANIDKILENKKVLETSDIIIEPFETLKNVEHFDVKGNLSYLIEEDRRVCLYYNKRFYSTTIDNMLKFNFPIPKEQFGASFSHNDIRAALRAFRKVLADSEYDPDRTMYKQLRTDTKAKGKINEVE